MRQGRPTPADLPAPQPQSGWSRQVQVWQDAMVVPPDRNAMVQRAGVLDARGTHVPHGALWRHGQQITIAPNPVRGPGALPCLRGRHLWGGLLFGHFGHFLTESIPRLWGLDTLDTAPDGLLFVQKRPNERTGLRPFQRAVFDLFGIGVPIHLITEPTRVETLVVPGQGFGLGAISFGTPEMRAFVRRSFAPDILPSGPDRLYVSRSGLGEMGSMILGEDRIETLLQAEGYTIFHPQDHGLATQIARFRAARQIIVADGSAAHLLGLVTGPHQQVAYLLRRHWHAEAQIQQIAGFSGRPPLVVNAIRHQWMPHNLRKARDLSFAEMDFPRMQAQLQSGGFVSDATPWRGLKAKDLRAAFERMGLWGHLVRADQTKPPRTA